VIESLSVRASDKIVSLFEPHTAILCRGKAKPKETEFGRKLWYGEVDGGLISEYRILVGNPDEAPGLIPSLQYHRQLFGKPPKQVSGDRGIHSTQNEQEARALGVRWVSLPQPGHKTKRRRRHEKQPWFRAAQRFRNGIEGRISQLRRARRLDRCLNHGEDGMERWVGWGVIANNLATLALFLIKRRRSGVTALG
jgi:IS5 family transposase